MEGSISNDQEVIERWESNNQIIDKTYVNKNEIGTKEKEVFLIEEEEVLGESTDGESMKENFQNHELKKDNYCFEDGTTISGTDYSVENDNLGILKEVLL